MKNVFWKIILIGSLGLLAACGGGTPAPEAKEIYVKADTGLDTNAGTLDKPLKTIKRALEVWKAGKELVLLPAIYSEVSGEKWPYDVTAGMIVKSTAAGVILETNNATKPNALNVSSVQIDNVTFKNFKTALVQSTGKQTLTGVTFEGGLATEMTKAAEATWSNITFKDSKVDLAEASTMTVNGAAFSSDAGLYAAGASQVTLENGSTPSGPGYIIVNVTENAKATVKNSTLIGSSFSTLYAGGNAQLTVMDSTVNSNSSSAIRVDGGTLNVKGGSLSAPQRSGIVATSNAAAIISVDGTRINADTGINQGKGSLQLNNAQITAIAEAITTRSGASLKLRNSTLTTTGGSSNVIFIDTNGAATSIGTTDLGTAASPGGNTFKNTSIGSTISLVSISTGTGTNATVDASGNTWLPSLQGADAAGKYAAVDAVGPSAAGRNYYINLGVTLKF
jgi:Protein of unknown function (DUF1565)